MGVYRFKTGKYKGKMMREVPESFLQWLLKNQSGYFAGMIVQELKVRRKLDPQLQALLQEQAAILALGCGAIRRNETTVKN